MKIKLTLIARKKQTCLAFKEKVVFQLMQTAKSGKGKKLSPIINYGIGEQRTRFAFFPYEIKNIPVLYWCVVFINYSFRYCIIVGNKV